MGKGLRTHDQVPYRSVGPVTEEEYLSRQERYDKQLKELLGLDPKDYETKEKVQRMRTYRTDQYEQLIDAVYARRGWTHNGIPSKEKLEELGMDLPEVIAVVEKAMLDLK
jgi:aldehyde:ferredoxin oxidoreductase